MASVMYTPSPSNRGSSNYSNRSYRSEAQKTENIRIIAGLWSAASIIYGVYFSYQLVSLVASGLGGIEAAVVILVPAAGMGVLTFLLFKYLPGRGVRAVTYVCLGCVAISNFFVPGFAGLVTVICIGVVIVGALCFLFYAYALPYVGKYRFIAVLIAGIPIVGAFFYVPQTLSDADLSVEFSTTIPTTVAAPLAGQLSSINAAVAKSYGSAAAVSYTIKNNRLYADICVEGTLQSVELDTRPFVQTRIPWLRSNLSRKLDSYLTKDDPSGIRLTTLLRPVSAALKNVDAVMLADGVLVNYPQQIAFPGKHVFRSASFDESQIGHNVRKWAEPTKLAAKDVSVVNAIPTTQDELDNVGIPVGQWPQWQRVHQQFESATPKGVSKSSRATKAEALTALQSKKGVMFIVAHYDGFSIRLPSGETLSTLDLDSIRDTLSKNRPTVFLFSCETARLEKGQSFVKTLLDHGAQAVVASTTPVSASDALVLFQAFLTNAVGPNSIPIAEAFRKARYESNAKNMEVWVADNSSPQAAWPPVHPGLPFELLAITGSLSATGQWPDNHEFLLGSNSMAMCRNFLACRRE